MAHRALRVPHEFEPGVDGMLAVDHRRQGLAVQRRVGHAVARQAVQRHVIHAAGPDHAGGGRLLDAPGPMVRRLLFALDVLAAVVVVNGDPLRGGAVTAFARRPGNRLVLGPGDREVAQHADLAPADVALAAGGFQDALGRLVPAHGPEGFEMLRFLPHLVLGPVAFLAFFRPHVGGLGRRRSHASHAQEQDRQTQRGGPQSGDASSHVLVSPSPPVFSPARAFARATIRFPHPRRL